MKKQNKTKTKIKKIFYIGLTIFLGLLLSFILHALVEVLYLNYAFANNLSIQGTYFLGVGWCALPVWTQYTFPVLGIGGGYFLGLYWWDLVYIKKRHWRFGKK
jgi:hypothetical protein